MNLRFRRKVCGEIFFTHIRSKFRPDKKIT
jgi:hypothetical protein